MHILFLTQIVPYPPDAGPRVKTWHALRYLVQRGYQVTLVTFYREDEAPHLETLNSLCHKVVGVPMRRSRLADIGYIIKSNLSGRPFIIERDDLVSFRRAVREIMESSQVDIIHCDQLGMAQFGLRPGNLQRPWPKTIFDAHNAVWAIVERMRDTAHPALRPILTLEAERVKHYEARIVQAFDHILAVSEPDAAMLWSVCPKTLAENGLREKMTVIPIAVDTTTLSVTRRRPHSTNILTLGTLHYPPNADGIRWFANEVFPLILQKEPAATLTIAGKNPPADFLQIAARSKGRIRVTGYVPDLTPLMEEAALVAVPVRAGGGIRVRILEAFARAMPVVTTTVGLEGIQARPGEDVLVEDDTDGQATAVIQLIRDEALQDRLARNGRKLAEEKYDWQIVLEALDEVYERIRKLPA